MEKSGEKLDYRVTKMKLSKDKTSLISISESQLQALVDSHIREAAERLRKIIPSP